MCGCADCALLKFPRSMRGQPMVSLPGDAQSGFRLEIGLCPQVLVNISETQFLHIYDVHNIYLAGLL